MSETDAQILKKAHDRYKVMKEHWSIPYSKARADLHFLSDEPLCQWDESEAAARTAIGRPAVQIDQLGQFVHQVTNDIRMNTPTIHVIPVDDGADVETAEVLQGRIKAIEYKSNADAAYDLAADFSVKSSIGFIRVSHDYVGDDGFLQELRIKRVINPQSCLIDNNSIEPDGSDSMDGFEFESIKLGEFKELYPDATPVSFGEEVANKKAEQDEDEIIIAHYFRIEEASTRIGLLSDGKHEVQKKGKTYQSTRVIKKRTVMHYKMADKDILDRTSFPGKYVPIVPVYGEEQWIEGKRNLYSLIRKSKSSQQTYNLWKSLETELLLKQQQAPVQAAVGQMRDFEDDWKKPEKAMVLYYHQTDANGNPAPPPQRLQPPTVPTGVVNAARETVDDIRATLGMYRASVGDTREQGRSGVALKQLEMSGDVATYHFGDNLNRSICHVGKILVCAMPVVEDTPRAVQTIGKEDEIKTIGINGHKVDKQERSYDFTKGRYDVRVITGASFTTQRQEAAAFYNELIVKMPQLMPVIGDLVFKYQDAPGAQAIAARIKKTISPELLDEEDREEGAVDPQVMALNQQLEQITTEGQKVVGELQQQLNDKTAETELRAVELELKNRELDVKEVEAQAKLLTAQRPDTPVDNSIAAADAETRRFTAEENAKNAKLANLIRLQELQLELVKIENQPVAPPSGQAPAEGIGAEPVLDEAQMAQMEILAGIKQNIAELTAAIQQPITFQKDAAGNIIGAS